MLGGWDSQALSQLSALELQCLKCDGEKWEGPQHVHEIHNSLYFLMVLFFSALKRRNTELCKWPEVWTLKDSFSWWILRLSGNPEKPRKLRAWMWSSRTGQATWLAQTVLPLRKITWQEGSIFILWSTGVLPCMLQGPGVVGWGVTGGSAPLHAACWMGYLSNSRVWKVPGCNPSPQASLTSEQHSKHFRHFFYQRASAKALCREPIKKRMIRG